MKIKRYKHARRILSFYKNTFGFHEPHQILGMIYHRLYIIYGYTGMVLWFALTMWWCLGVLSRDCMLHYLFLHLHVVDGTFCQAALKGKIQLREQLTKYLGGEVQLGEYHTHTVIRVQ